MKNETTNDNMNESQIRYSIKDATAGKLNFIQKGKTIGSIVRNHPTFGGAGGRLCTGPPGRARSPGTGDILFPDHPPNGYACSTNPGTEQHPVLKGHFNQVRLLPEIYCNTEYQIFSNKIKIQFFTNIKFFKIMKKQILILAIFILALMAGTLTSFGQLLPGVTGTQPIPAISCATNALPLHPVPGLPFTYTMNNTGGAETSKNWTWWATQDPNFIPSVGTTNLATRLTVASGDLISTSADYGVDNKGTASGTPSVTITWSAGILAGTKYQATGADAPKKSTFIVGYSEGNACADNIQVFEINPQPNFTIDIAAIDPATSTTSGWADDSKALCVDKVQSATYNAGNIDMNYGTNTIYYEVAAANFVTNFAPTFQIISGLRTTQTAVISMYTTLAAAQAAGPALWTSASLAVADMGTPIATSTALTAATLADVATGVSVYVKVVITNNGEESLTNNPFDLAVDAQDNTLAGVATAASIWDMEDADCPTLVDAADQVDNAIITVNPRPTMNMDGAAMGEPSSVAPEDVIQKNP